MAAIGKKTNVTRVSPLKPGLRGARNWATSHLRAASYSRKGMWRFILSLMFIFFAIAFLGLWLGGFLPNAKQAGNDFTKNRLISMGFVVDRVDVMGEGRLSEKDVRRVLGVQNGDYLFDLDLREAQRRVESLSWVEKAIVRRLWPDRIVVQIIERKPYALWQNQGVIQLVDISGEAISQVALADYPQLPLIVGGDAPENFVEIEKIVANFEGIRRKVDTFVYHNTGRWDLILHGGEMRVKLPQNDLAMALSRLTDLHFQTQILDRELSVIDLRIADRITLAPSNREPA